MRLKNNILDNKILVTTLLITIIILLLIIGLESRKINEYKFLYGETSYKIDSLINLTYYRSQEQCEYFGMCEDSILAFLPTPTFKSTDTILTPSTDPAYFWPYSIYGYLKILQDSESFEPVRVHDCWWTNMPSVRNTLNICFALQDSVWRAVACVEYDSNSVEF